MHFLYSRIRTVHLRCNCYRVIRKEKLLCLPSERSIRRLTSGFNVVNEDSMLHYFIPLSCVEENEYEYEHEYEWNQENEYESIVSFIFLMKFTFTKRWNSIRFVCGTAEAGSPVSKICFSDFLTPAKFFICDPTTKHYRDKLFAMVWTAWSSKNQSDQSILTDFYRCPLPMRMYSNA